MIQCKPPVTLWCNNLSLAGKRPVRIKLPLTRIQYLREVPAFRSAGHIFIKSMVSLKMSILQIWVTSASKVTQKNLQLCSIKNKGSHTPCDITCSRSIHHVIILTRLSQCYSGISEIRTPWDLAKVYLFRRCP